MSGLFFKDIIMTLFLLKADYQEKASQNLKWQNAVPENVFIHIPGRNIFRVDN